MLELLKELIIDNRAIISTSITTLIGFLIRRWEKKRLIRQYSKNEQPK